MLKNKYWIILIICLVVVTCACLSGCSPDVLFADIEQDIKNCAYDMNIIVNPDSKTAECVTSINYDYSGGNATAIKLLMNSNVFTTETPAEIGDKNNCYPIGDSYGSVTIKQASLNGSDVMHSLDDNTLTITAEEGKISKGKQKLTISYDIKVPYNRLRYGINYYSMQLANFYPQIARIDDYNPIGDPFYAGVADYNVEVTYPRGYKLAASGDEVTNEVIGDNIVGKYEARNIRDYAIVVSKNVMTSLATSAKGYEVKYYYHNDKNPDKTAALAANALDTFSELFGDYHHNTLSVVQVDFAQGGMEFGTLIYVTLDKNVINKNDIIIHETAHQWWYGNVGSDQINHAWQDEALTEFSVELYYRHNGLDNKANDYNNSTKRSIKAYVDSMNELGVAYDDRIDRPLSDFVGGQEYFYNVYNKGHLMFDSIYKVIGEKAFMIAIREYYKDNLYKQAKPQNLYKAFNKAHQGSELLFKSWLEGNVMAIY